MYITLVLLLFLTYVITSLWKTVSDLVKISKVPSTKGTTLFGNAEFIQIKRDALFKKVLNDSIEYYPIFKYRFLSWAMVCIVSPEDMEAIISKTENLTKSAIYDCVHPWLQTGLVTSTDKKWKTRRKILTPTFHFNILQQFVPTFVEHSEKLCNEVKQLVGQAVDVVPILSKHTLHIICETAMGTKLDGQESTTYRNAIHKMGEVVVERIVRPWLYTSITFMFSPLLYQTLITSYYLRNYTKNIIKEKQKNFDVNQIQKTVNDVYTSQKRLAMLDMMLYAKMTGADIDDGGIREEVDTFLFEGHDTTSICVTFTLLLLANNPDVQMKAVEELKEYLPNAESSITYDILNNLNYLDRIIKESLRLYPSVPNIGRQTSKEILTPSGYIIPKGTNLMLKIYEMHHNPNLYPDPEKFDPDRFLPENAKGRHPYSYIPFSAGPRNCIGQKFAMLEVKTILASILRRFELLPVDTPESVVLITDLVLRSQNGVRVEFRERDRNFRKEKTTS